MLKGPQGQMTAGSQSTRKYLKRETLVVIVLYLVFEVAFHMLPIHTTSPGLLQILEAGTALILALLGMAAVQKFWPSRR